MALHVEGGLYTEWRCSEYSRDSLSAWCGPGLHSQKFNYLFSVPTCEEKGGSYCHQSHSFLWAERLYQRIWGQIPYPSVLSQFQAIHVGEYICTQFPPTEVRQVAVQEDSRSAICGDFNIVVNTSLDSSYTVRGCCPALGPLVHREELFDM